MEILFLVPPSELNEKKMPVDRVYGCNYGFDYKPPIHLLQLATIAQSLHCKVKFLDCPALGYNKKRFIDYIKRNSSINSVVFFSVWLSKKEDLLASEIISHTIKDVKIIFSGSYPTWKPEAFIKNKNYFVIRGEPEKTFIEFIQLAQSGQNDIDKIRGLSFLNEDKIIHNDSQDLIDLNTLAFPNRRLLKGDYFFNRINAYPATAMCVSRGCSYRCNYCAPGALDQAIELECARYNLGKPALRLKNAENTIKEFQEIASLGYHGIEICDNQFVWDKERTVKISQAIKPLGLKWICCARADHLKDKNTLKEMQQAGCRMIYIGTESFNQAVLNDINKDIQLADNYAAVKLVRECGIEPEISVLLGASVLETEQSALDTIQEAKRMNTHFIHYSIALPVPHTPLYKIAKEKGWIQGGDFMPKDNIREALLDFPHLKARTLRKILRKCYMKQYLSLHFIIKQILNPPPLCVLKYRIKAFWRFLKYIFD